MAGGACRGSDQVSALWGWPQAGRPPEPRGTGHSGTGGGGGGGKGVCATEPKSEIPDRSVGMSETLLTLNPGTGPEVEGRRTGPGLPSLMALSGTPIPARTIGQSL